MKNILLLTQSSQGIIQLAAAIISVIFLLIEIASIGSKKVKAKAQAGELIFKTTSPSPLKGIVVCILCPLLILFCLMSRVNFYVVLMACGISCLSSYMISREQAFNSLNGIYKNAIIGGGQVTVYEDIKSFAGVDWKNPESKQTNILTIELKGTEKRTPAPVLIAFTGTTEYCDAVEALKKAGANKGR